MNLKKYIQEQINPKETSVIDIPKGKHILDDPIEINSHVIIKGNGGLKNSDTIILAPNGAFVFRHENNSKTAFGSQLSGIRIIGNKRSTGIDTNACIEVKNISIEGFDIGLRVKAEARSKNGNANLLLLKRVFVDSCNIGFNFQGRDSNQAHVLNCQATNCKEYGLLDMSLHGNNYYSFLAHGNKVEIKTAGGVHQSSFYGCYVEFGNPIDINGSSVWYGGTIGNGDTWVGNAFLEMGTTQGALSMSPRTYRKENQELRISSKVNDEFLAFVNKEDTNPGLTLMGTKSGYSLKHRRLDARNVIEITSDNNSKFKGNRNNFVEGGQLVLQNGAFIGDGSYNSNRSAKIYMSDNPESINDPYNGDLVFNSRPKDKKSAFAWQRINDRWIARF